MPAGPRVLYYGLALSTQQLIDAFESTDLEEFYFTDNGEKHFDYYAYRDDVESCLQVEGYEGILFPFEEPLSFTSSDFDKPIWVYGFKITQFEIFEKCEFDANIDQYTEDLNAFKAVFNVNKYPRYYCVYTGD